MFKFKKHIVLFFFVTVALLVGCKKDINNFDKKKSEITVNTENVTLKFKDSTQLILSKQNNRYVLGGDVILSEGQLNYLKSKESGAKANLSTFTNSLVKLWPGGIIYYTINNPINQNNIQAAINYWQQNTIIQFIPRTNQVDYIEFSCCPSVPGAAGESQLGRIGGMQLISLADNASKGTIIHEIGHALGLYHEQMRADRDQYINVNYNNINSNFTSQYSIIPQSMAFYLGSYDFDSIMGYGSYYASVAIGGNTTPQMTKKNGNTFDEQRDHLSIGDIEAIYYMYAPTYVRFEEQVINSYLDYYGSGSHEYREVALIVHFYADASYTTPVTTTKPIQFRYVVSTNTFEGNGSNHYWTSSWDATVSIPAGVSSYVVNAGLVKNDFTEEYGNATQGSFNSDIFLPTGVGYKFGNY